MSEPAVWKEVVNLRGLGGGKPGQYILHVLEWIYAQAFAGLDDTHDRGGGVPTLLGAGEEPVAPTQYHRLDAAFTGVVADFNESVVEVNQKSRPAIESVGRSPLQV